MAVRRPLACLWKDQCLLVPKSYLKSLCCDCGCGLHIYAMQHVVWICWQILQFMRVICLPSGTFDFFNVYCAWFQRNSCIIYACGPNDKHITSFMPEATYTCVLWLPSVDDNLCFVVNGCSTTINFVVAFCWIAVCHVVGMRYVLVATGYR